MYFAAFSLPFFLEVDDTTSNKWMEKKKYCKAKGNYPIGNLTLSNIKMACTESNYNITSPRWIGVIHEVTMTEDQGCRCLLKFRKI